MHPVWLHWNESLPLNIMLSLGQGYFVIFHIGTERGRYFVIFQTYFRTVCSSDPQGTSIGDSLVAFPGLFLSILTFSSFGGEFLQ